jgi:hypothetical protein
MTWDDLRRRAAVVREVPLETVLLLRGAERDRHDKSKWHSERGPLSVTGPKFMNWHTHQGGGKAIDLVMHLAKMDYRTAVAWLEQCLGVGRVAAGGPSERTSHHKRGADGRPTALQLPIRDDRRLHRVTQYLTRRRHLRVTLLELLLQSGKLYADSRGNAVFLLLTGKTQRPVGAELRGTGPRVWRGMAPGTRKDAGYFWIGTQGARQIVLCESAIDAISCFQMRPERICISTSGVRANPFWLRGLIAHGYEIYCGFDADDPGDTAADRMLALYPVIQRLRPPAHDWNDALTSHL